MRITQSMIKEIGISSLISDKSQIDDRKHILLVHFPLLELLKMCSLIEGFRKHLI